ncbi:MAG: serine/threonine protein kinase [Krumholzibacteria bacterium]|nr:serine/threonine protein kinase [Candidatus Krumholzibacteria bacterium]
MDPGRWRTLSAHFGDLADLPPPARAARLAGLRREDPALADEVASLLDAHDDPAFLAAPPTWGAAADLPDDPLEGELVGPYRIVERVGAGGMGVVYRAVRADDQYRKEVALKLVRRGMDTEQVLGRFRTERQILANLDHPHIARLLDGGVAPDGRPYLVMEFVDGLPIDTWCVRRELPLRARLELFLTVCAAVQHAHRNLVVHRDLKPANILVMDDGRVQLLDFGVAKLLDPGATDGTVTVTVPGTRLLTPRYAAPELLRGEAADTLADVWSLGVILFELLAEQPAFTVQGRSPAALARALGQKPAPRPSAVSARFAGRLRGDLDTIVGTALQADPKQRFGSVEALAQDVRRHLDGQPITARPGSPGYRAAKFFRRNALAVGAATALFTVTLVFALLMAGQAARIGRQARETALQRDRAERVTALLVDMFDVSDPMLTRGTRGDTLSVRDFLIGGQDAMVARLDQEPLLQADIMHMYGRLFGNLGENDRALALTADALARRRALLGADHPDVARSLDYLATLHQNRGAYAEAETLFVAALELRRRVLGQEHGETAESINNLGVLYDVQGQYDRGEPLIEEGLRLRRRLLGPRHVEVAQSLNNLAVARWATGDNASADSLFAEALSIRREVLGARHPYVANTLNNLARLLRDRGDLVQAEAMFTEAITIWEETLGPDHASVSAGYYNLGLVAEARGDLEQATASLRRCLAIDRGALPPDHPYVADGAYELGRVLLAGGRGDEAAPLLREAYAIRAAAGLDTLEVRAQLDLLADARGDGR